MASSPQKRSTAAAAQTKQVVAEEEKSPERQSLDVSSSPSPSPSVGGGGSVVVIPERGAATEEAEAEAEKLRRHSRRKSEDADRALRAAAAASSSSSSTSSNRGGRAHNSNNNSSSAASISALSSAASTAAASSSHASGSARCISPRRTSGPSRGGSADRISRRRRSEETERRRIRDRAALEESASRERKWFLGLLSAMANKRNNNNNAIDNKNNTATPSTTAKTAASSSSASSRSAMNDNNKGDKNAAQKKRDETSSPVKVHKKSNDDNKKKKEDVVAVVTPSAATSVATTKEEDKAILAQANTKPQQQQSQPSAVSTDGGKLVTVANEPKKAPTTMSRSRLLYICVLEEATNTPTPFISSPVLAHPVAEASNDDLTEIVAGLTFRETETDHPLHQNPSLRRYARFHLKVALQFMGCKPLQASQITEWVFQLLKNPNFVKDFIQVKQPEEGFVKENGPRSQEATGQQQQQASAHVGWNADEIQLSETGASVTLTKPQFLRVIRAALNAAQYFNANPIEDFCISCDVINRKHSFIVLLGGTSGCGKSTLASLLASRIGFTTVISTDNIRHMLRSFMPQEQYPVLWASTYHAGEVMADLPPDISYKERILRGYKAQSQLVFKELDNIITGCERRHESLIVEGVHLNMDLVVQLMKRHPTCIPFLIYISNEAKHRSRFAIRSKYMTLDPRNNKYIKYFKNIRIISDFLCRRADRYLIPKIDNTSVDRSLSALHSTLFACIRRYAKGERMFDAEMNMCPIVHREYEAVKHAFWSSKVMYKVLKKKRISLECQKEEVMLANEAMKRAVIEAQDEEEEEEDEEAVRARSVDEYFADGGSIGS